MSSIETHTSPLWCYVIPGTTDRWLCDNHMCRSPFFQWSWDGFPVCNGCLMKPNIPRAVEMDIIDNTTVDVHIDDWAREMVDQPYWTDGEL